ncbi:MAG TPA: hypothetical protein VHZ99_04910 [Steroidobacteraceae bacterium]|jgi:hypothetical protein|nr:hypothetical protein [Steroidobacteraceae bacterium]
MKISDIARRVTRQRARRARVQASLDDILAPTQSMLAQPGRLYPGPALVIDLAQARAQRRQHPRRQPAPPKSRRTLAAAILGAAIFGAMMMGLFGHRELLGVDDGRLIARGALNAALNDQLTGQASAGEHLLLTASWRARDGEICRNFSIAGAGTLAATACREHKHWLVHSLASPGNAAMATAHASTFTPLSNAAERELRAHHWQSP